MQGLSPSHRAVSGDMAADAQNASRAMDRDGSIARTGTEEQRAAQSGLPDVIAVRFTGYTLSSAGRQVFALVDTGTIHIDGYFEETKLPRIRVGDQARVHIMGIEADLPGIVESLTPESKTASAVQAL
jgi:hypothetical protein